MNPGKEIEEAIDGIDDALDSCLQFVRKKTRLFIKCPDLKNCNGKSYEPSMAAMQEKQEKMDEVFRKIAKAKFRKKKRKARKK